MSGLVGTALVVLFMMYYYRFSGVVANLAMVLNVLFMMAVMSLFRATLTLPGIAGIILSIGMAVDSNVLIFERMREEFKAGKSVKSGVDSGYDKAFWTIIDSHVTTLITAFALFLFGSGPIKGFAVTLSIGVIFNLFTALFCTRVVYDYLSVKRLLKPLHFVEFLKKSKIDFIESEKICLYPFRDRDPYRPDGLCADLPRGGQPGGGIRGRHHGPIQGRAGLSLGQGPEHPDPARV